MAKPLRHTPVAAQPLTVAQALTETAQGTLQRKHWAGPISQSPTVEELREHEHELIWRVYSAEVSLDWHTTALRYIRTQLAQAGADPLPWQPRMSHRPASTE